jgi:hypothetical protein
MSSVGAAEVELRSAAGKVKTENASGDSALAMCGVEEWALF